MGTSIRPPRPTFPVRENTLVPLDFSVPKAAKASDPSRRIHGRQASVSKSPASARTGPPGILIDSRPQGRIIAARMASVLSRAQRKTERTAQDALSQESLFLCQRDGRADRPQGKAVLGSNQEESFAGSDGIGGDGHAFDHAERIGFQQRPVDEGTRIAVIAGADDAPTDPVCAPGLVPWVGSRESRPVAVSQPGGAHPGDHFLRGQVPQAFLEGPEALPPAVFLEGQRIDFTAILEHKPHLLLRVRRGIDGPAPAEAPRRCPRAAAPADSGFVRGPCGRARAASGVCARSSGHPRA